MSDVTEAELIEKSKAPRVTKEHIDNSIRAEYSFTAKQAVGDNDVSTNDAIDLSLSLLTFYVIVMENGFTFTGQSACADPANFDPEIGARLARADAYNKIWSHEGYVLKSKLGLLVGSTDKSSILQDTYIGKKVVHAQPMNRLEYNILRQRTMPEGENGEDEGYLIEYADGQNPNVAGYQGYVQWLPKDIFEAEYKSF